MYQIRDSARRVCSVLLVVLWEHVCVWKRKNSGWWFFEKTMENTLRCCWASDPGGRSCETLEVIGLVNLRYVNALRLLALCLWRAVIGARWRLVYKSTGSCAIKTNEGAQERTTSKTSTSSSVCLSGSPEARDTLQLNTLVCKPTDTNDV